MTVLDIQSVSKAYNGHQALKNVSIQIPQGSIFGLLGPNGAGKTTLIRIITRIIEQDSGEIFLNGSRITTRMVREIGYLPEERGLYKKMKVGEQLLYLAQLRGMSKAEATKRIYEWLERLSLTSWIRKKVEDLSKGMAQKVQFIATVLHQPQLLILDEPFSGFDPVNANLIKDEILRLRDQGATIIFSTHRMESVEELCDHIALINKSEKILEGPKVEIKNQFKDGTYIITHQHSLNGSNGFNVLSTSQDEFGRLATMIQDTEGKGSNAILQSIMQNTEVYSFIEKVPTINEIFIKSVKEETHA
ncbi:MAG: ATP-binding cassette domain-containing protein [Cyclobacteriaceae bacterium]